MNYYLTTPIYYVNAAPHIGHAYTTIVADLIRRFKAMQGYRAVLTTGTDEHGVNVERAAERQGKSPREFCDVIAEEFRTTWEKLGLTIDRFMRTTDPRHATVVQDLFDRCRKNGYVYKGSYTGPYCPYDNLFVTEAQTVGEPCPLCGRPTEAVTEENFFFKLSAFQDRLLELYDKHPDFIQPETRRNEVKAFVAQGLQDVSVTRTGIKWGIPVKGEAPHVFYVWFDALITYMSAVAGEDLWPADLHLIGKEIVRFHAVYWPAFLWAADVPIPKRVFAHGWLLFEQEKMSKSRGNIVRAEPIRRVIGTDALRYYLLREVAFGQDGSFSYDSLVGRFNADLANGLGNLASRTLTMVRNYANGRIPEVAFDEHLREAGNETIRLATQYFDEFQFHRGLETIWAYISRLDKYIVEKQPWTLARQNSPGLPVVLYNAANGLRIVTALLAPVVPEAAAKIWNQLGMTQPLEAVRLPELRWEGQLPAGQPIGEVEAVFPRIDAKLAIPQMRALEEEEVARQAALLGKAPAPAPATPASPQITIDDFARVDLRVARVLGAEPVKGANKLLKLTVDAGEPQPRTLVAGIAEAYAPEVLIGRKVVIVANLEPRKLRGIESNGMIVAASVEGGLPVLAGFLEDIPVGARLK